MIETAMILALAGTVTSCATNVALPLARFSEGVEACSRPPSLAEAQTRAAIATTQTLEQRQAAFEQGLYRYRGVSLAARFATAGVRVFTDSPLWQLTPQTSVLVSLAEDYATDHLEGFANDQLEEYLTQNIDAYLVENPGLGSLEDAENLNAFARYLSTKVDTERFGPVTQEIDAFLIRQVAANRADLEAARAETRAELDAMQGDIARLEAFQVRAASEQTAAVAALRKEFESVTISTLSEIRGDLDAAVRAQEVLTGAQTRMTRDLRAVRDRVDAQQTQIASNTQRIGELETAVSDLSAAQAQIATDVTRLTEAQRDTAERLEQNEYRVDVVAAVLWERSDPETRLRLLDEGAVRVSPEEAAELREALQDEIVEARATQERAALAARLANAGEAIQYGQRAVALAARNGLSQEDAQKANKIMSYAQVAIGLGRLYSGDPNGLGNIMGGLEGLSGSSGQSAEMSAIQQGFRQINQRLDVLIEQNVQLSKDIEDFRTWSAEAHLETQRQFARLERLTQTNQQSLDYIQTIVAQADPPTCRQMAGASRYALAEAVRESPNFGELRERWQGNPVAGPVIRCLVEVTNSVDPTSFGFVHETSRTVLLDAFPRIRERRRTMMLSPTFDGTCPTATLLSDDKVLVIAQAALDFDTLVYGYQHQDQALGNFPEFSTGRHRDGHRTTLQMYDQVATLLDCAMAQQAVLHGGQEGDPVLNLVQAAGVGSGQPSMAQRVFAADLMRADLPTLRRNLAVRILSTEFRNDPEALTLIGQAQEACGKGPSSGLIETLNGRIRTQRFEFVETPFHLDERCSLQIRFTLREADNGQDQAVTLTFPDAASLKQGALVMPPTFDALVQLRLAVENQRNAYTISNALLGPQGYGSATLAFGGNP